MSRRRAAGRLRARVTIEYRTPKPDGYGGERIDWSPSDLRVFAEVKAPSGMSAARALLNGAAATYRSLWSVRMDTKVAVARLSNPEDVRLRVVQPAYGPELLLRPMGPPVWDSDDFTMSTVLCEAFTHET